MKKIFTLLLVIPIISFGQKAGCANFTKTTTDKFTDEKTLTQSKDCIITNKAGQKINLEFSYYKDMLVLTWINVNEGSICVDNDDILYFLFDDGSKSQVHYPGSLDCDTYFHFFFNKDTFADTYNSLLTKKIASIRLFSSKALLEFDLPKKSSDYLNKVVSCLVGNN